MKHAKKITALLMALCLSLSLNLTALAAGGFGGLNYSDDPSVAILKVYKLEGAGTSPAETFTLRTLTSKSSGAPSLVGSSEKLY